MAKLGFNGQWVPLARVGRAVDNQGTVHDLSADYLQRASDNYMSQLDAHEAPIGPGHPVTTSPAYGWLAETRFADGVLEGRFAQVVPEFETAVATGQLKKRSTEFYENHPVLKGPTIKRIGFLGAMPPGVKGLKDIQFSEEGEYFALEENLNLQENEMGQLADADVEKVTEGVFAKLKNLFSGGSPAAQPAATSFNEDSIKTIVQEAVTAVETKFGEKITALETENKDLKSRMDSSQAGSRHAEVVSFVESYPAEKGRFWLKRKGIVEFLERLANDDAADQNAAKAVSFSEGEGDAKKDVESPRFEFAKGLLNALKPTIEFGEKYGSIVATEEADATMIDPARAKELQEQMGTAKTATGGEK